MKIDIKLIKKSIATIFYSIIFALGINLFVAPSEILSSGMTGIAQIVYYMFPIVSFSVIYILINIPGIILSYMYLGKRFTFLSMISIFTVAIATAIIPVGTITDDTMLNCIFGGIIMGYALAKLLKNSSSTGGTDFYAMFFFQKFGLSFVYVSTLINIFICIASGIFFGLEAMLFTIVYVIIRQFFVDHIYVDYSKVTIWVVGEDLTQVSKFIVDNINRTGTYVPNAKGIYSDEEKEMLMVTLDRKEFNHLKNYISTIKNDIFITSSNTHDVCGKYPLNRKVK